MTKLANMRDPYGATAMMKAAVHGHCAALRALAIDAFADVDAKDSTITAPSRHHHCTITAPSLHHHCTITAPSLHHHCSDGFKYRYYIQGPLSDGYSNALTPLPGEEDPNERPI